ncbi:putative ribonuclease H-like domain-containing protein [Tanacetum coccineum]|uniref:Ribonuclease H-like domain-containing protein n=1 Tax=Tanacetum coccineum TaxID=301880 RepID=A0ABQ5J4D7_9ASTR
MHEYPINLQCLFYCRGFSVDGSCWVPVVDRSYSDCEGGGAEAVRLIAQGFRQEEGIDYDEVFAPVARIEAIRLFLAFASFMGFPIYQMDVKSAFLYGTIEEESMCTEFEDCMHKRFQMSSMGELTFFLGLQVKQQPDGIFISQHKYVADILKKFDFCSIKTATTPIEPNKPLVKDEDGVDVVVHVYRFMISSLMYLTVSRPDIMFAVCACARFQVTPKASHLHAVKRIFRYLKHQPKLGLWYPRDSPFELEAFSDSDYGGASLYRKSITGGCQFLGRRLISWQCKNQTIVANSTTEAKYVAAATVVGKATYGAGLVSATSLVNTARPTLSTARLSLCCSKANLVLLGKFDAAMQIWCCQANLVLPGKFSAARQKFVLLNLVLPGKISMANLDFVDQHNMVACLKKTEGNSNFHEIVDFLASSSIHHALTVSPPIYTSYIEQFWNTASSQTVNDVKQINATVDSKAVVVTEASIRSSLLFNDADGTACLTNEAIFQNLALMGYEGDFNKLTFQKALFSPQWKFLIHTILHCLSSKSTSWNEFSTNIASAVICLATNQKFNFSKLIFDGMLRNLDNTKKKFLMYPRFLMVFLNNQIELGEPFNDVYPTPAHNLKVFTNMSRKGLKFLGKITPLFPNMLTHATEGEDSGDLTEPQPTPSPTQPSTGDQPPETSSSHTTTLDSRDTLEGTNENEGDQVQTPHDSPLSGGHTSDRAEGALNLQELSVLCTNLSNRVLALESIKDAQAAEISALKSRIKKLEKKCKPSISHHRAWLKSVNRLSMKKRFGKKESVSKQGRKKSKPESTLDDSTVFDDQDADHGMEYMETEEAMDEGRQSGETEEVKLTDDTEVVEDKSSGDKGGNVEELVSTARPEVSTARPDIDAARQEDSAVEPRTPPTTTSIFDDEDITMAQTLIKMKEEKAKEKGVSIKDVDDSSRPARSILTLKPLPTIDPKDKGKGVLKESPVKKVKRSDLDAAQIAKDAEIARLVHEKELAEMEREREEIQRHDQAYVDYIASLYDKVQAKMDASEELAARLQMEEREMYTIEERSKLIAECFERRKKLLAEERATAVRNKPPIRTQLRSLMMTYLKYAGKYRHNQLNKKTFEEIQALYIKEQERDADFVPIGSERDEKMIDKMNKKAVGMDEEEVSKEPESTKVEVKQEGCEENIMKRSGRRLKMKATKKSKRQKTDSDLEEEEQLRASLKIVPDEEEEIDYEILGTRYLIVNWESAFYHTDRHGVPHDYYRVFRANRSSRYIKTFTKMVSRFDILDFIELHSLVMQRFSTTTPEGIDLVFHILALEDGTEIHMLAERRYPLIRETLERMMELRLTAESEGEAVFDLLRFIQKQIDEFGGQDGSEKDL